MERYHGWYPSIIYQAKYQVNTKSHSFEENGNENYHSHVHEMQITQNKNKHTILSNGLDNS